MPRKPIAHVRKSDSAEQTLERHLTDVSEIAGELAAKTDMADVGRLLGLLHDFGKYSWFFSSAIIPTVAPRAGAWIETPVKDFE